MVRGGWLGRTSISHGGVYPSAKWKYAPTRPNQNHPLPYPSPPSLPPCLPTPPSPWLPMPSIAFPPQHKINTCLAPFGAGFL